MNNNNNKIALTMESLDLPREYWDLKLEPASPTSAIASELFALDDPTANFLYDDNFATGLYVSDGHADSLQEDISMDLLSDEDFVVEFLDLKDEECLLDQKSPHFIDYESAVFSQPLDVAATQEDIILPVTKVQVQAANQANDSEFQHGDSSSLILQQLTPPQSPPQFDGFQQQQQQQHQLVQQLVKEEQKVLSFATNAAVTVPPTTTTAAPNVAYNFNNNWVPVSEIARETQLVDDIVNMRAQELQLPINWQQLNDDCESQASSSFLDSSSSSRSSNCDVSGTFGSFADADEEWLPANSSSNSSSSSNSPSHHTINEDEKQHSKTLAGAKKRTRTYGRGVEDRKIRKKEQNKNAATRYRQKKKIEMEHVLGEELELTHANEDLRRKLNESRRESRYLRQLIREFYKERKQ